MIINWDTDAIKHELNKIARAENDPYETGFNTVMCKKDLYTILWHIEDLLDDCSTYFGEDEWLKEREKQKTWKALGGKT